MLHLKIYYSAIRFIISRLQCVLICGVDALVLKMNIIFMTKPRTVQWCPYHSMDRYYHGVLMLGANDDLMSIMNKSYFTIILSVFYSCRAEHYMTH